MSTVIKNKTEYHDGYFIAERNISIIEGKLLTVAELLGLEEKQSEALKSEIRNILWGRGVIAYGIPITGEEIAEFRTK